MVTIKNIKINKEITDKVLAFGKLLEEGGLPVEKLVIFGSYAKNTEKAGSDIDVAVISPSFGNDLIDEMQFLFKQRMTVDALIEPYPLSPDEFKNGFSPILSEIKKYGVQVA